MITTYGATEGQGESLPAAPPQEATLSDDQLSALSRLVAKREQLDPERRALVESMAQKHKLDLAPAKGFTQLPNPRREQMSDLGEAARVAALPMGGQLVGGAIGALVGGIPGEIAGQSIGGVAGLAANKALGISKPDEVDMALTGAAPVAGGLLMKLGRKAIPGHAAAEQQIAAEAFRDMPKALPGDQQTTKQAYDTVRSMGSPPLPVPKLSQMIGDLVNVESVAKKYGGSNPSIRKAVMDAGKTLQAQGGAMPFEDAAVMLKRYREKIAGLEGGTGLGEKGGEAYGAYKAMRKALFDDMADAEKQALASGQNVTALRSAMTAAKQSIAKQELTDLIEQHGVNYKTVGGQTFEVIEPTRVLNKLKAIGFDESVGKQWPAIEATLKDLAKVPRPDMATGAGIGTPKRAMVMAGAGAMGALHGPPGALGASVAAAGTMMAHDAVASLMMSDRGRNFLVKMFKQNQGRIGERTGQILQFAASQFQEPGD